VDQLGLELGYRLIALVDKNRQGDLLNRIKGVRKKFAQEVGFLPPAVHVRDNLELNPSGYRITLRGVVVGEGEAFPGLHLAINPGGITTPLIGTATTDPAFGLPAHWIDDRQKEAAQMAGFTVVDSETVMATHLSHLMQVQASRLLSRTETQQLVDHVAKLAPKLIEEVVPKMVSIAVFQKVLQLLLDEAVHIRDIRTIVESIAEHAPTTPDPVELAKKIRIALSPAIVQQIYGPTRELNVIAIDPPLERLLMQALGGASGPALDPGRGRDVHPQRRRGGAASRKRSAYRPACWCPTRSVVRLRAWCAASRPACRCSPTVKFQKPTRSVLVRFSEVQHHEHSTFYRRYGA
jgi:flagellar biosynthesis protein FlhA